MPSPLLTTKLYIPPKRPELVHRPRLISQLNKGLYRKLTLVSAPAGYGKSTLITDWVDNLQIESKDQTPHELNIAWLSIDSADNDLARFLSYLITALQTHQPSLGESVLAMASKSSRDTIEPLLTLLLNDLAQFEGNLVVILDDYHLIQTSEIHQAMVFLLEHAPPKFHIVIATRSDPPFPLSRWHARGQLLELRAADLRFNSQETAAFLSNVMTISLSEQDISTLTTRTEGWIAGLQMAALSLQRREDVQSFIEAFSGSHEFVADFLTDEVLAQQPENYQKFLLQTSILEHLSSSLCEAVTSQPESAKILSQLNKANLFVVPLDDQRQWYRYHHLFADLLRQRLNNKSPELISLLHRRASQWYEENGMLGVAIDHALSAGDSSRAAILVEQVADQMMMRSEIMTLLSWVEQLPPSEMQARPLLILYQAGAQLISGYPLNNVRRLLDEITNEDQKAPSGELSTIQALIASFQGESKLSRVYSHQALEDLPEDNQFLRSLAAQNLGFAFVAIGDLDQALKALHQAVKMAKQAGSPLISAISLSHIAEIQIAQGHLRAAEITYEQALRLASDKSGRRLPIAGMPLIGIGELRREQNQLEQAYHYIDQGLSLTKQWSSVNTLEGHLTLARILEAQGKSEEADCELQMAQECAIEFDATEMDDLMVAYHHARILIMRGKLDTAKDWLQAQETQALTKQDDDLKSNYFFIELLRLVTHIRLELASGKTDKALSLLKLHQEKAKEHGVRRSVIEGKILQALAFDAQGNDQHALDAIKEALLLSEQDGFIRLFVDEGQPLAKLLYKAAEVGCSPEYAGQLLGAFPTRGYPDPPTSSKLIEPLSARETEILTLIAKGLTNQEIANQLVISLRTVKWHTSNIYGKLEVKNRTEAAAQGRELGILPTK